MKDKHITDILDSTPVAGLSEDDLQTIRAHVEKCAACSRSFEAARISALLIKERVEEADDESRNANPFFQTRVLAAWREQQSTDRVPALRRLWNATGALVTTMTVTTAALAVLTFVVPAETINQDASPYSAEVVVFDDSQDGNQVTDDQLLSAIYAVEDEDQ